MRHDGNRSGVPVLLAENIESMPDALRRIAPGEWAKAVLGDGNGDVKAAEKHLQDFIALCPEILPGEPYFSPVFHPLVCIGREVSTDAGSIDCLFISRQGRLTIVETKLFKNPEGRRVVVAQLLEYCEHVSSRFDVKALDKSAREFALKYRKGYQYIDLWQFVCASFNRNGPCADDETDDDQNQGERQYFEEQITTALKRGELLGLIVGDRVHPCLPSLLEYTKKKAGLALELGLVELAFYRPDGKTKPLIVVPTVKEHAIPFQRMVVEVGFDQSGKPEVRTAEIKEEGESVTSGVRPPTLASRAEFLNLLKSKTPVALPAAETILTQMEAVANAHQEIFTLEYGRRTAMLYWSPDDERQIKFLSLDASQGRLRVPSRIFDDKGYVALGDRLDQLSEKAELLSDGKRRRYLYLADADENRVARLKTLVEDLAKACETEAGDPEGNGK